MSVVVGEQIQAGTGTWQGVPTSFAYQWQSSADGSTGWANVTGENRSDYIVLEADAGLWFRVEIVATNAGGSSSAVFSEAVGPVGEGPAVPTITVAPVVTGTLTTGETLTLSNGTWTNTPLSYTYRWQSAPAAVGSWSNIAATSSTYLIDVSLDGLYIRGRVVAANADGSSSPAYSAARGPIEGIADIPSGSHRKNRRAKGGTIPSGRIRRTVV